MPRRLPIGPPERQAVGSGGAFVYSGSVADLPLDLANGLAVRLERALDVEGKIPRAFENLGPIHGADLLLTDPGGGMRAAQLANLGAHVTVLGDAAVQATLTAIAAGLPGSASARIGTASSTGMPDASLDVVANCWSGFRDDPAGELAEAERILRPGGRVLILHDYGRDDVSRLRPADLPEYAWSHPRGWFLQAGFKVRVIHCWWTFADLDDARDFLATGFGEAGRTVADGLSRPRLSYNVAIYHRTHGAH